MDYIEIKNIKKYFKKNMVLNDISLSLQKNKIYGFQGINGSGKTMLFRAILGLIHVDEGEIYVNGKQLDHRKPFPVRAGVLIENPGFVEEFTGVKNLQLLAAIQEDTSKSDITNVLREVGLNPDDTRKVKKYSLGMKQKLGIAQAFLGSPDVIVLDEPTNALDEQSLSNLEQTLLRYRDEGKTLLIASHDKEFLNRICDETIKIHEGKIVV